MGRGHFALGPFRLIGGWDGIKKELEGGQRLASDRWIQVRGEIADGWNK